MVWKKVIVWIGKKYQTAGDGNPPLVRLGQDLSRLLLWRVGLLFCEKIKAKTYGYE
jgi:hypothetical protein